MTYEDELCREALVGWIHGWPKVVGWTFKAEWDPKAESVCITTRLHVLETGETLTARDSISESEMMHAQTGYVERKALDRWSEMDATKRALEQIG